MHGVVEQLVASPSSCWTPGALALVSTARDWLREPISKVAVEGGVAGIPGERLLDLAANLLDAAEMLARGGALIEAFALEGVQGRLLEAILGGGAIEA